MANVDITPDAEADIRGLQLEPPQRVALVTAIIHNLSYLPSRHPACQIAGPLARRYHEGPFLVIYDVSGSLGNEAVVVLNVLPGRGGLAGRAIT
jgi:hypothetical protein